MYICVCVYCKCIYADKTNILLVVFLVCVCRCVCFILMHFQCLRFTSVLLAFKKRCCVWSPDRLMLIVFLLVDQMKKRVVWFVADIWRLNNLVKKLSLKKKIYIFKLLPLRWLPTPLLFPHHLSGIIFISWRTSDGSRGTQKQIFRSP